ncbi:MAG: regulatory protein [Thermosediminibacterales bacterium]|nr:regulatory protein [Thermosediminibacterales bacterium]
MEEIKKAYNEALKILSYKNYTSQEIYKKLINKGFKEDVVEQAVRELKQKKYLNDEEYAKLWLENHQLLKPVGKRKVYWDLAKKGIPKEIIEKLVSDISEEYEYQTALKLANTRIKRYHNDSMEKKLNKTAAFLKRRGFGYDVIIKILQELKNQLRT